MAKKFLEFPHCCTCTSSIIILRDNCISFGFNLQTPVMNQNEFADLQVKTQLKYAKFCQSLLQTRKREQRTLAILAQSKTMIEMLENRPDLHSYNPKEDWEKFHSLPLHIATKARMEHKAAMTKVGPFSERLINFNNIE